MTNTVTVKDAAHLEQDVELYHKTIFGFWVYLMTDCVLFSTFFAAYAVLHNNTFGGLPAGELFSLPFALKETMILLTSSFTCGLAMIASHRKEKLQSLLLFGITFALGVTFLMMELTEFKHLIAEGNSWTRSGFLSSFFTLVGCHGLHITCGLLWMLVMFGHILIRGFTPSTIRRLACLSLFWHFLDVIWVLIFTFVYLMGAN